MCWRQGTETSQVKTRSLEVLNIFRSFDNINIKDYVTANLTSTTRNNDFKVIGKRLKSNGVKHFFYNRIANI